jgi:hypothetical protein
VGPSARLHIPLCFLALKISLWKQVCARNIVSLPMGIERFPRGYRISILQEPRTGAVHGPHYLSRVPLEPALIVYLDFVDMTNLQLQVWVRVAFHQPPPADSKRMGQGAAHPQAGMTRYPFSFASFNYWMKMRCLFEIHPAIRPICRASPRLNAFSTDCRLLVSFPYSFVDLSCQ